MSEVIMRYSGEGEDLHDLKRVRELVRCRECVRYDTHNKRCRFWNHGQRRGGWCNEGKRKEDDE